MSASNIRVLNKYIKFKNKAKEAIYKEKINTSYDQSTGFSRIKNKTVPLKTHFPEHKK